MYKFYATLKPRTKEHVTGALKFNVFGDYQFGMIIAYVRLTKIYLEDKNGKRRDFIFS